ncbi:MAG TPA: hypothetical protein VM686_30485 [Polyangiaceae bacterium]|nr:hypothetical protein [Polyangiaceae bacterium]
MTDPLYVRSTRGLSSGDVPETFRGPLAEHAAKHQLELGTLQVWLTHSENPPASGFVGKLLGKRSNSLDPDAWHDTLIALHPTHLIVGTHGPKRGTTVLSLPLMQASVQRGRAIELRRGMPSDDGISIEGFPGDVGRPGTYFVGLGPEPAANDCFAAIEGAVRSAKNRSA